jgi:hypothetical protein
VEHVLEGTVGARAKSANNEMNEYNNESPLSPLLLNSFYYSFKRERKHVRNYVATIWLVLSPVVKIFLGALYEYLYPFLNYGIVSIITNNDQRAFVEKSWVQVVISFVEGRRRRDGQSCFVSPQGSSSSLRSPVTIYLCTTIRFNFYAYHCTHIKISSLL